MKEKTCATIVRISALQIILPSWDPGPPPAAPPLEQGGLLTVLARIRPSRQRRGAGFAGPYSHERRSSRSNGCHGALQGRLTCAQGALPAG